MGTFLERAGLSLCFSLTSAFQGLHRSLSGSLKVPKLSLIPNSLFFNA